MTLLLLPQETNNRSSVVRTMSFGWASVESVAVMAGWAGVADVDYRHAGAAKICDVERLAALRQFR